MCYDEDTNTAQVYNISLMGYQLDSLSVNGFEKFSHFRLKNFDATETDQLRKTLKKSYEKLSEVK